MNSFVSKPIVTTQTIGERLRKAREGAGLSIEEISLKLGIKARYLVAIELGVYSELPGDVYACGFIKKYSVFLKMDPQSAKQAYQLERSEFALDDCKLSAHGQSYNIVRGSRLFGRVILSAAAAAAVIYCFIAAHAFFSPPVLVISTPAEYTKTDSPSITLQGRVDRGSRVSVNSEPIFVAKDGTFIESFNLPQGANLIRITAQGRFGKRATEYRMVVVYSGLSDTLVLQNRR